MDRNTNYHSLLGQQVSLTAHDAGLHLAGALCESLLCSSPDAKPGINIFGRPVAHAASGDISFSMGFGATGLRAGIILTADEISSNLTPIAQAGRMHIPLVILAMVNASAQVNELSNTGAVVFAATNAQEVLDLLLLSYRVAEFSLVPVVVCIEEAISHQEENILFPGKDILSTMAGNPDTMISSPTAAQQIIFGKNRKRIPNWFTVDHPVSIGGSKSLREGALETAAQQEYFHSHVDAIIADAFNEYSKLSGRNYSAISVNATKDADYLVLSYGRISATVIKAIEDFRVKDKAKIAAGIFVQVSPFPAGSVKALLARKKAVTILEQAATGGNQTPLYKEVAVLQEAKQLKIFSGQYGVIPSVSSFPDVLRNMLPNGRGKAEFWMDIDFTHAATNYPKHQVLLQAIEREYPGTRDKSFSSSSISKSTLQGSNSIPLHIRQYKDQGPAYTKLARFYDDTASFFLADPGELVADPFQALPVMPPSTAVFNAAGQDAERKQLPVFNASNCTACGDCFLHCPHGAINPVVIGMENLIKAGMAISNTNGVKVVHLTPMVRNLAKAIPEVIKKKEGNISGVADFLPDAFAILSVQMKLEGEKLESAKQDIDAVTAALHGLPISMTDLFFSTPELIKKGSGEVFSLAIDVDSCTGCGVCSTACNDDALSMEDENTDLVSLHRSAYNLWEQLPDTGADTIIRQLDEKKYNPFSAILLSRHFNQALSGTSNDRDGDSSKSMVRLIAAMAEASLQPRIQEAGTNLDELINGLSSNIHTQLSAALPSTNLDGLSRVLAEIKEDRNPFETLIEKLGSGDQLKLVDTKSLKRKVELAKSLRTLKWLLLEGSAGTGRARMGIVTDGSLSWNNAYPWNNFTAPVMIQLNGTTPELARGIVQGHIRQMLDNIKIIRRAALEIKGAYEPEINDVQIASLAWNDLTAEEKNLVPPILIIGNRTKLGGKQLDALIRMLDGSWPLKAVVLDDAAPGTEGYVAEISGGIGALLPALAMQHVSVLKSSLAVPQHLFSGLSEAFNSSKPALAWVYTPAVARHLSPRDAFPKLYTHSLHSRAYTVFNYNPDREGNVLSSKLDITGNPEDNTIWIRHDLVYTDDGEEKTVFYPLTWADWAFTLKSWRDNYSPHTDLLGKPVLVADYIMLPLPERAGKSPVIYRVDRNGALKKYHVSDEVVAATQACADTWMLLREISGELTAFPEKLQQKIESELAVAYEERLSATTQAYEDKIANLEQEHLERIRIKLKEKLVMLSQPTVQ